MAAGEKGFRRSWGTFVVRRLPTACSAFALALATVTPSRADQTWTGNVSTDWFTAGNWSTAVPTNTDDVTIDTVNRQCGAAMQFVMIVVMPSHLVGGA